MNQPLAGRHALVTGGGRGIGAAIAAELASAGALITIVGRTGAALEETAARLPAGAAVAVADVTDAAQVARAFETARRAHGEVSLLVNNAGRPASRAAVGAMLAANWGRIVDISSTARSEAEARETLVSFNPQQRLVQPAEVANAVRWLCLPGSESINGQSIAVAGGEVT